MKTIAAFLSDLKQLDVNLWADGDRLRCDAPKGTLTPELRAKLAERKADILQFLHTNTVDSIQPVSRAGELPLSFAQQRLWFLDQLEGENATAYNVPMALSLDGPLRHTVLEQTIREIIQRHETLRTTFPMKDGKPRQVIHPLSVISDQLSVINLQALVSEEQAIEVQRLAIEEAQRPFDLSKGPLLRSTLLQKSGDAHILLLSLHHIISDGWSVGILIEELSTLYKAFLLGQPSPLPALPIQYVDFAHWQRQWLTGEVLETQLHYWQQQLADAQPVLEIPGDHPRPPVHTFRGGTEVFELTPAITQQLTALCQQTGVTLFMIALAAFTMLMGRYSGQTDLLIGSGIANRNRKEIESMIGFFVNTLALRIDLSGNPTFVDLLKRVQQVTLEAYDNQDIPFEQLVEVLQPKRDISRNPLVQVAVIFQNAPTGHVESSDLLINTVELNMATVRLDLECHLWEQAGKLNGLVYYYEDVFEAATIQRMLSHFQTLLAAIATHPRQPIADYSLLNETERHQLVVDWNRTEAEYPVEQGFHQLFEAQAETRPDAVAVVFEDQQLTYQQLNTKANQLAHYLQTLGVKPEVLVGLCVERCLEMIIGVIGILKAGGAYVPLDPSYPQERIAFMLADSQVSVLLTQQQLITRLPPHQVPVVSLDSDWALISKDSSQIQSHRVDSTNLAYVIYTSGSTGKPKGVLVTHQGWCNLAAAQIQLFAVQPNSRILQFASLSFDASSWEIAMALGAGATLVLGTQEALLPGSNLIQLLRQHAITHLTLPPSALAVMPTDEALFALQYLVVAGEACALNLVSQWSKNRHFFNAYGPTESTVCATIFEYTADSYQLPIGRPLANTQIYILDSNLQPTPIGVPGELHIGGTGLARGYLKRPALTAETFIPNPFSEQAGASLYQTGDLACYRPNGQIEYLGRIDHQVKLRGYRIELAEIEAVLNQHPAVQDSVITCAKQTPLDKRLTAYIVCDLDAAPQVLDDSLVNSKAEQIAQWEHLFDEDYRQSRTVQDLTFNITGWNSSYTGLAIPAEEMREWVDSTVDTILSLQPKRVLEIGCGSGLLLCRIAPHCEHYWGTDFSPVVLQQLAQLKHQVDNLDHVTLFNRTADDFSDIEPDSVDTLIINSVIQYFPNVTYLLAVLEQAIKAVKPGGYIFVGDVRNLQLLKAYHASVQLYQAPDSLSRLELQQRVQHRLMQEEELAIDPTFFLALQQHNPRLSQVNIQPKRGRYHNELIRFRYNVILRVGEEKAAASEIPWLDWQPQQLTLSTLRQQLLESHPERVGVRGVPNARVEADTQTLEWLDNAAPTATVAQLRETLSKHPSIGIEPEDVRQLGDELAYDIELSWANASADGSYDVLFTPRDDRDKAKKPHSSFIIHHSSLNVLFTPRDDRDKAKKPTHSSFIIHHSSLKKWHQYANNPLQSKLNGQLVPQLRQFLQKQLPEYMVPAAFVMLDAIPLTPNGKVDRRALPSPEFSPQADRYVAPRTPTEKVLATIWIEVLGVSQVGIHDNFFELGGHSLLATQVMSRIRDTLSYELPLRQLFESPTVAELAQRIEAVLGDKDKQLAPSITPLDNRAGELPVSFAQERLWFLNQLTPDNPFYNSPLALRLTGSLNIAALDQSLVEIVQRHETLRTTFSAVNGVPMQVINPLSGIGYQLSVANLQDLSSEAQALEVPRLAMLEARRTFDLQRGPLCRATLLQLQAAKEYLLLLTFHHIIIDGWSLGVLFQELTALYQAFSTGAPSPLPALPIQYADFAHWQRQWLSGRVLETQLSYWQQQLADAPQVLEIPSDHPRPPVHTFRGDTEYFELSPDLTRQLNLLSQQAGVTPFMLSLAALALLIGRYSSQEDIVIGSAIANRNHKEIEALIGFFVNTLALRIDLSGHPTFLELLKQVQQVTLEAYAHQELPFEQLVEAIQPARDMSRNPLVQITLTFQNAPDSYLENAELNIEPVNFETEVVRFDLEIHLWEYDGQLRGYFHYYKELFEAATIKRLLGHFQTLLAAIAANPKQPISACALINETEQHQLLVAWNDTVADYPFDQCIHQLFENQVAQTPEAIAVVFENQSLSYLDLNRRANQLAHYLQTVGVKPEVLVGICIERSCEMVIGLLGILKAGGAYLPLDPTYPATRNAFMLEDAQVPVLLTQQNLVEKLPTHQVQVICLDTDWPLISRCHDDKLNSGVVPANLAYVIYTSGSTGKSKGVLITHQNLVHSTSARFSYYRAPPKCYLLLSSVAFDSSVAGIFWTLTTGGILLLPPPNAQQDTLILAQLIQQNQVSHLLAIPSLYAMMLAQVEPQLSGLGTVIVAGEPCAVDLVKRHYACLEHIALVNEYGPTEATVWSSAYQCLSNESKTEVPIGTPITNTQLYILDNHQRPVPIGIPGELHIGGVGLARGYFTRPELTAEKFVPNPFSDQLGSRLYKTGDSTRYLPDGQIEYLGRIDNQVKLRGFRIELGEIEAVLTKHPMVQETVVLCSDQQSNDNQRLIAYTVLNPDSERLLNDVLPQSNVEQISQWAHIFEESYNKSTTCPEMTFNIVGWNSSYTGLPIPAEEMREWVESTVNTIVSLKPKRVLEIGCGTGLLLFRIAPHCSQYWGTDLSSTVVQQVEQVKRTVGHLDYVTLLNRPADDFSDFEPNSLDTVIINSVIQYFPSITYLLAVLESAIKAVQSGGYIFIGDVRSLPLLKAYHASIQLYQAPDPLSRSELQQRVQQHLMQEEELVIDPTFFLALKQHNPRITHVKIQPKRGHNHNELTRFRYDVILQIGTEQDKGAEVPWIDWRKQQLTLSTLRQRLEGERGKGKGEREYPVLASPPKRFGLRGVPNARLDTETQTLEWLANAAPTATVARLRETLSKHQFTGIDPEDFWQLGDELAYDIEISWANASTDGRYDVLFTPRDDLDKAKKPITHSSFIIHHSSLKKWYQYANNPLQSKLNRQLVPQLRQFLQEQLPEYMVPAAFVMLDAIPLAPNGKVDRRALPPPDISLRVLEESYVAPRTPIEDSLVAIWAEVLGLERVGIHDNFFELGGHSLLATQVVSRVRDTFVIELPLNNLFKYPTVAGLAACVDAILLATEPETATVVNGQPEEEEEEEEGLL